MGGAGLLVGVSAAAVAVTSMVAAVVMRTFVLATMLASASSFAPAPKTQLAMRRPPPTPRRVMPPVMIPHGPLHCVGFPGFPSQASKNWEIAMAKKRRARERYLSVCLLTGFAFTTFVLAIGSFPSHI